MKTFILLTAMLIASPAFACPGHDDQTSAPKEESVPQAENGGN